MKKAKKILALLLCAILLVGASIAGTVAYLTSQAEVKNSFSVGNVSISMDEAKVNEYGKPLKVATVDDEGNPETFTETDKVAEAYRVADGNTYKLIPGKTYTKDPKITIEKGSEPCWVFIQVTNHIADFEIAADAANAEGADQTKETIIEQLTANGWEAYEDVFYYLGTNNATDAGILDARNAAVVIPTFTNFTIATDANSKTGWDDISLASTFVTVTAYAVQAEGLSTVDQAWAALNP